MNSCFPIINRLSVLSFQNGTNRIRCRIYYLPIVEIKDYNVLIDGRNFFDQTIRNKIKTNKNTGKVAIWTRT